MKCIKKSTSTNVEGLPPLLDSCTGRIINDIKNAKFLISKDAGVFVERDCKDQPSYAYDIQGQLTMTLPLSEKDTDAEGLICVSVSITNSLENFLLLKIK